MVTILIIGAAVGTVGNFLIIYSVTTNPELRKLSGNLFICNLAVADLIVTSVLLPVTAGNMLNGNESVLGRQACMVVGFLVPTSCNASMQNLMMISVQRLMITSSTQNQTPLFQKKSTVMLLVAFVWVWSVMLNMPLLLTVKDTNENLLIYDKGAGMCAWDDVNVPRYPVALVVLAYFVPVIVSSFCYYILFTRVKRKGNKMSIRSQSVSAQLQRREHRLLKTILIVLIVFLMSWTPYCFAVIMNNFGVWNNLRDPAVKRPLAWLGMFNSTFNSFIYGWRNASFRQGYALCGLRLLDGITSNRYRLTSNYTQRKKAKYRRPTQTETTITTH
uniref:melanopsin-B-like n=1 Tax=Ciona intestinalis TaxID=7719 RepID=UPI00089DD0AC|nr:melanopsin-B-like [Ciona intestinalis]|eukprot:XP_018670495.1 melanopsin-B-like [Ciona intestinalis]